MLQFWTLLNCVCIIFDDVSNIFAKKVCGGSGEVTLSFGLLLSSQVASLPALQEEEGVDSAAEDDNEGRVYFVLEESSGYMEPSLHLLAVAHTIISFCCIIGYYCLKVYWLEHVLFQINKKHISVFKISSLPSH